MRLGFHRKEARVVFPQVSRFKRGTAVEGFFFILVGDF